MTLVSDINSQVKNCLTKYFKGYFHKNDIFKTLPSVQLFEVDDINLFKKDRDIQHICRSVFGGYFALDDDQVEVHFSDSWNDTDQIIQIFKQKGHGIRETRNGDLSDYDDLESITLIDGVSFPCVFNAILQDQNHKINKLKRQIYDQIKLSGKRYILKYFFLLGMNRRYLKLKYASIQILLTIKRFEDEFSNRNIRLYTRDNSLDIFKPRNFRINQEKNLLSYFTLSFKYQINRLNDKSNRLNEVFKSLEEFNSYKTNLFLQLFSVVIAILAFIFAFDSFKEFLSKLYKLIIK